MKDDIVEQSELSQTRDFHLKELNCEIFIFNTKKFFLWSDLILKNLKEKIKIENSFGGGFVNGKFLILTSNGILKEKENDLIKPYITTNKSDLTYKNVEEIFNFFLQFNYLPNFNISNITNDSIIDFLKINFDSKQFGFILSQLKEKKKKF